MRGGYRLENAPLPWQMREAQSMGKEALAEPVRSGESRSLSPLIPSQAKGAGGSILAPG